jgi:hypothetical protein
MKTYVLMGLVVLMPLAMVMAQSGQWESMDGPYYIYNATGISIGYQDNQTNAYAVGSDLENTYIYSYQGSSPIQEWQHKSASIPGLKYVSASRYNGLKAYVATDENASSPLVKYSTDGGASWRPTNTPPANTAFTGIAAHPNSASICFTSSKHVAGVSSIYKTINGGADWSAVSSLPSPNDCNAICIDPNSGNEMGNTIVYACFKDFENVRGGIYRSTNGGTNWEFRFDFYGDGDGYNGICATVKQGDPSHIYAITWRQDSEYPEHYLLWYSFDSGISWDSVDAVDIPSFWIEVREIQGQDVVTTLTPTEGWSGTPGNDFYPFAIAGHGMQILSACRDVADPFKGLITGQSFGIFDHWSAGDDIIHNDEVPPGGNRPRLPRERHNNKTASVEP